MSAADELAPPVRIAAERASDRTSTGFAALLGPRGVGKSWVLGRIAEHARAHGRAVIGVHGRDPVDASRAALGRLLDGIGAGEGGRPCVLVDDADALPVELRWMVRTTVEQEAALVIAAARRADGLSALVGLGGLGGLPAHQVLRLGPLDDATIDRLLAARGIADAAARRCAAAAAGNPGLALALADGLSDDQRAGRARVPALPRLASDVADELHVRLRELGEHECRALMVAAAEDDGELGLVLDALGRLGEPLEGVFDVAEEVGVVERSGGRLRFVDPWTRLAAYHLLAPASRRAAHRALAAAAMAPRHVERRVRHLVAGCAGPDDEVADALGLLAAVSARRGRLDVAAGMAEQAAELAADDDLRQRLVLLAIGWHLDRGACASAARLVDTLDADLHERPGDASVLAADARWARAEVRDLCGSADTARDDRGDGADHDEHVEHDGPEHDGPEHDAEGDSAWAVRRRRREQRWRAAFGGDHRRIRAERTAGDDGVVERIALATACRHAGDVRDALDRTAALTDAIPDETGDLHDRVVAVHADVVLLGGRVDDARSLLDTLRTSDPGLASTIASLRRRADLADDPTRAFEPAAICTDVPEPLRGLRTRLAAAIVTQDAAAATAVADDARRLDLPVEAGEALLAAAELAPGDPSRAHQLDQATTLLHRCGVRLWDARLRARRTDTAAASAPALPDDPALATMTPAERRVADAVAGGATNREVAAALFLSVKTVDFHLQQIYRKLGVRSRTELAVRLAGRSTAGAPSDPGARA